MKEDGIYFDIFAIKDGRRYNVKEVSLKDLTNVLTENIVDSLGSLITDLDKETIKDSVETLFKGRPKAIYIGYSAMDQETFRKCPVCDTTFGDWTVPIGDLGGVRLCTCPTCKSELEVVN